MHERVIPATHDVTRYKPITRSNVVKTRQWDSLGRDLQNSILIVSAVLPFRTNSYVMDHLIDWDQVPDDPIYQLTFPQRGMLSEDDYAEMARLIQDGAAPPVLRERADRIRYRLNPHPAGQMTHNVPLLNGEAIDGVQHKYDQTVLFFPAQGQTCHAYCTFCFRWAQFVGIEELKFSNRDADDLVRYLGAHREVTDVLFTGGDPMIMSSRQISAYFDRLLDPALEHIRTIRIGTKAPAYWPQRFLSDPDADDLIRAFEKVVNSGKHLALMGHYSHPAELSTDISRTALARIRSTGAVVRMQSPIIRHVNDDPRAWAELWQTGVQLGAVPYYMFVERDTGARNYFEVPLIDAWRIFREAYREVSGLARSVRGPSMSAMPGKVHVLGVSEIGHERVFVLEYLQARNAELVRRPFFARYNSKASWFDQLEPATPADRPFFETPEIDEPSHVPLTYEGSVVV
jgi:KamA family protein